VKVYERQDALLHSKTAVIDGVSSTVGSMNLDQRSLNNDEINAVVLGEDFANQIRSTAPERIINGIIAVPSMAVMMMLAVKPTAMEPFVITRRLRILGWLGTGVMALVVLALFATWTT
jgi:hypothetical protein